MAPLSIPDDGLHLQGVSSFGLDGHLAPDAPQPQVMRLDLAGGVFGDIVKASRMGKDIHMSFGKNIVR